MGSTGRDGKKVNMLITLAIWCVLCAGSMAAMLIVASKKTIVIVDAAQNLTESSGEKPEGDQVAIVEIQADVSLEKQLNIPLEKGTKAEQVTVENRYMERELWISIKNADSDFYGHNPITGDVTHIGKCCIEEQEEGVLLKIQADTVWEYHSTMEDGNLKIAITDPKETFRQIVVLDPVEDDKVNEGTVQSGIGEAIALQVAKAVQKKVNQPEIKIYIAHSEVQKVSKEQRLSLVEAVQPDLFLQIGVLEAPEDEKMYGISAYYNDEYYIPDFGNVEWADAVTKKVTVSVSNRALGMLPAQDSSILKQLNMPAAKLCLGYLTNSQERALLLQENYQEKLAEGIAEAIGEVYTNICAQKQN